MKFAIISENEFNKNEKFFKDNIGFVYNFDDFDNLRECTKGRFNLTRENFEEIKANRYNSIFNEYKDNFEEFHDKFFLSIAYDDRIYSIACFTMQDNSCYIDGVETVISHRKRGLASKVLKQGLEKLDVSAQLHTRIDNLSAQKLYLSLGFKETHRDEELVYYSLSPNHTKSIPKSIKE